MALDNTKNESIGQVLRRGFVAVLSGGLDSTVCTAWAISKQKEAIQNAVYRPHNMAVTFDYGQRAVDREITAAKAIAKHYHLEHRVISIDWLKEMVPASLQKPDAHSGPVHDGDAASVWVPNRNGVILNSAAAVAEFNNIPVILFGSNREEADAGFPDNTFRFRENINLALRDSTSNSVRVMALLEHLSKIEVLRIAFSLEVPLENIWSCYRDGAIHCGECASCLFLKRALITVDKEGLIKFAN
jgi:7-cyano-7-deazaguanine synthase